MTECEELTPRGLNLDWQTKESCEVWYTVINIVIDLHQKFMKVSPPKNGNVSYKQWNLFNFGLIGWQLKRHHRIESGKILLC